MNLLVVGYDFCQYFVDTCTELSSANIPYTPVVVASSFELKSKVQEIRRLHPVRGIPGTTSPQIFRVEPDLVVAIGGHDDLENIGLESVMSWQPLKF
jgi:hypothetical protein